MLLANETKAFIENETVPIAICGTNNAAHWVGYFLDRCKIDYKFYVDKTVKRADALFNDKPVVSFEQLAAFMTGGGGGISFV